MDSGLLYVNGPLTITGKVTGNGAIVVRGAVTVTGQMNLKSDLVALVAEGDVTVQGKGQDDGTRVQGLVYTKGSFKAQDSTIVGAVVSARVDGTTELDRVNMIQIPGVTDFEVVVDEELRLLAKSNRVLEEGLVVVGVEYQGTFIPFLPGHESRMRELAEKLAASPGDQLGVVQARDKAGSVVSQTGLVDEINLKTRRWETYIGNIKANRVERTEIFKLDLNSFLSVQGELEVLLWESYRQRAEEQENS